MTRATLAALALALAVAALGYVHRSDPLPDVDDRDPCDSIAAAACLDPSDWRAVGPGWDAGDCYSDAFDRCAKGVKP